MVKRNEGGENNPRRVLRRWIESCTRGGKVSRNTVAVGIVVLDHLRKKVSLGRTDVISPGGEIKGARSGLTAVLQSYGVPSFYLKEVTTRQGHQDGQRLLEALDWGRKLSGLPLKEREELVTELIGVLKSHATDWLGRQNLKLQLDRRQGPSHWVHMIVENARDRSQGIVEQHLVGAKLQRRFKDKPVPNHPAHAADQQTAREGDFAVSGLVYHVTAIPSRGVLEKCRANLASGKHPVLLIPSEQELKARALAQDEGVDTQLTIASLESFVALNIIELATDEAKDFFTVLQEIVRIYNKRLSEVETDLSLQIEIR